MAAALPAIISAVGSLASSFIGGGGSKTPPAPKPAPPAPSIDQAREGIDSKKKNASKRAHAANLLVKSESGVATAAPGGRVATGY